MNLSLIWIQSECNYFWQDERFSLSKYQSKKYPMKRSPQYKTYQFLDQPNEVTQCFLTGTITPK